jgi:hypothetical protein
MQVKEVRTSYPCVTYITSITCITSSELLASITSITSITYITCFTQKHSPAEPAGAGWALCEGLCDVRVV